MDAPTDAELIDATLKGDNNGFAALVHRYKGKIFRLAANFARDRFELDDVCQDVFLNAYKNLGKFRKDAPFEHWLTRIAVNTCYDLLRRRQRSFDHVPLERAPAAMVDHRSQDDLSAHEAKEWLDRALSRLKPDERLVITLFELEEKSVHEVAVLTGWSEGNVKVRLFRARKALKKMLEADDGRQG